MGLFRLGFVTPAAASLAPFFVLRALARAVRVREIQLFSTQATESKAGLVVPAVVGYAANASGALIANDPRDPDSICQIDTGWAVAPTLPGAPIRYSKIADIGAVIGNGVTWQFQGDGLPVPAAGYLALFNFGAGPGAILGVNIVLDE